MEEEIITPFGQTSTPEFVTGGESKRAGRATEVGQTTYEALGLAVENQWLSSAAERISVRSEDFEADPDFRVTPETLQPFELEFDSEGRKYLAEAKSQAELNTRAQWLREDIKRHEALSAYGVKGTLAELAAGVFDPLGWAAGMLTGPVGLGAKASRLSNIGKTGALVGAESAAFEAALAYSDTQRGADDIMMATAGGVILGGSLGALFRTANPQIADAADQVDQAVIDAATMSVNRVNSEVLPSGEVIEPKLADLITINDVTVKIDNKKVEAELDAYVSTLTKEQSYDLRGKQKGDLKKEVRSLEAEVSSITSTWKQHRAKVAANLGAPRNKTEAERNAFRYDSIDRSYQQKIDLLNSKISPLKDSLAKAERAPVAKKELAELRNMSRVDVIRKLFPEGVPKLKEEVQRQVEAYKAQVVPVKEEVVEIPQADDSAGAARVKGSVIDEDAFTTGETQEEFIESLIRSMDEKPQPINIQLYGGKKLGKNKFADLVQSAFTTLDNSDNLLFRALAHKLLENPQGNFLPEDTASILSYVYGHQMRSAVRNRVQEGYESWAAKNGEGIVSSALDLKGSKEVFDKAVFKQVIKPDPQADADISKAADGLRDGFRKALEIRKGNGEAGFEEVISDPNYMPIVFDGISINSATAKTNRQSVEGALSKGYQTGRKAIPKKYADKIAELQYERAMNTTLSARQSFERVLSRSEEQEFVEGLVAAGIDDATIKSLLGDIETREIAESISNRAKSTLGINVDAEYNGVKVMDLINTNVNDLAEGYFKEAAGGAALARHGFKTEQQLLNVIDAGEKFGRNLGKDMTRMGQEANMLRDLVSMIMGRSVEENPNSSFTSALRMGRAYTTMIRLQQIGFSTFPELARTISHLGLSTVLKSIPSTAFFRRRAAREGGVSSGQLTEPELREMEFVLGYVDEDNWTRPVSIRHEDATPESNRKGVTAFLEKALAVGSRITNVTSGFQAVQGGLGKVTTRSIKKRLVDMAEGRQPISKDLMKEVGWSDDFIDELMSYIKANPKEVEYRGSKVKLLNAENMTPQMREKLAVGFTRMSGRLMQKHFVGDSSVWMNKTLGKTLTQFRSFMLVSAEKQLVHDLRGDKTKAAQIMMWSSLLAYISYTTQVQLAALGEEDPDEYLAQKFSDRELAFGVFNKLPQTAIISLGGDALATLGAMPDAFYAAPNRHGFRPQTTNTIAPVLGTLTDVAGAGRSVIDLISGDVEGRETAEKVRRLLPVANSVGIGQMLKAGIGEL